MVTGCAGFIGSHVCESLLKKGEEVVGVDSFDDYYSPAVKVENLSRIQRLEGFTLVRGDLNNLDLDSTLDDVDTVIHLAAQAGVRCSWGADFRKYVNHNVMATQRLLEVSSRLSIRRFIYASSSSVYGNGQTPMKETQNVAPFSPYGVTKAAGELLVETYHSNFGLSSVTLRFFTVYGPRQRPDMAFHRWFLSIAGGDDIELYGDGSQVRDFTYVDDVVSAILRAIDAGGSGTTYNIGGGKRQSILEILDLMAEVTGKKTRVIVRPPKPGDVHATLADITAARRSLDYAPRTDMLHGLRNQWEYIQSQLGLYTESSHD